MGQKMVRIREQDQMQRQQDWTPRQVLCVHIVVAIAIYDLHVHLVYYHVAVCPLLVHSANLYRWSIWILPKDDHLLRLHEPPKCLAYLASSFNLCIIFIFERMILGGVLTNLVRIYPFYEILRLEDCIRNIRSFFAFYLFFVLI